MNLYDSCPSYAQQSSIADSNEETAGAVTRDTDKVCISNDPPPKAYLSVSYLF